MRRTSRASSASLGVFVFAVFAVLLSSAAQAAGAKRYFDIAAGEAPRTLNEFSRQSELQISFDADALRRYVTNAIAGEFESSQALAHMLGGTGLAFEFVNDRTIAVMVGGRQSLGSQGWNEMPPSVLRASAAALLAAGGGQDIGPSGDDAQVDSDRPRDDRGMPEVLVKGARSLNLDIKRSRDDVQPYIVFERDEIEKSGARTVEDFLRRRVTTATTGRTAAQTSGGGNLSSVDLRGLGTRQTLVLVDGHRIASRSGNGGPAQSDLNGIPPAAIERIEVLSTTASGIYGGGATGGVINIVLRRDYSGVETKLSYENSFDGGGASRRVDISGGFTFGGGDTTLLVGASYLDGDDLLVSDRDFLARGRELILANNPAAIVGAARPPLGATTNIRSTSGANLTLKPAFGGASLGSPLTFVPLGYDGPASDNGAALVANAGRYNLDPADTVQTAGGGKEALLSRPEVKSAMVTLRQRFTPWLEGFIDVAHSENTASFSTNGVTGTFVLPASAASNPFNQQIRVTTPAFGTDQEDDVPYRDRRFAGGAIFDLPGNWVAGVTYTWNRTRFSTRNTASTLTTDANAAVNSGQLNLFRDTSEFPVDFAPYLTAPGTILPTNTRFRDAELRISGALPWSLPGGAPRLTALLEHWKESYDDFTVSEQDVTTIAYSRSQTTDSLYLEALIPLISEQNRVPGVHLLEMQLAARRDDYALVGANQGIAIEGLQDPAPPERLERKLSSTDPTAGLRWQPTPDLTVRASYSSGFVPPELFALVPGESIPVNGVDFAITDPRRGNEPIGEFMLLTGGNPELRAEESESRSAGVILTPRFAPGLRLSADWTRIEKTDNTSLFFVDQPTINNELLIPGLIARGPPSGGFEVGPITEFSTRFINVARQDVEAIDVALDYRLETPSWGAFHFSVLGTRNLHNVIQVISTLPEIERAETATALKWRAAASLNWDFRNWTAGWSTQYLDSYYLQSSHEPSPNQGSATIPRQIYHDLLMSYRFPNEGSGSLRLLNRMEINAGIKNVLDKMPPIDARVAPFYSPLADPRLRSYFVSVRKNFF